MKTRRVLLPLLLWSLLAVSPACAMRDPFWPIGYSPAPLITEKEAEPAVKKNLEPPREPPKPEPPKPEPPRVKPVSEDEWSKARKALTISGVTKSVKPDTGETRILAMIERQMFSVGDTVSFVHMNVRFQWRVASIINNTVDLEQVQAERLALKNSENKLRQ